MTFFLQPLQILICLSSLFAFLFPLQGDEDHLSHSVLAPNPPYAWLVKQIGGETIEVYSLIPPEANMHTYEPTPKQVARMGGVDLWLKLGNPIENKVALSLTGLGIKKSIDLRDSIDLICSPSGCSHCQEGCDIHYWLSPRIMKTHATLIASELKQLYPDHSALYDRNLQMTSKALETLDHEISALLTPLKSRFIFASHPAYAYFARDYDLAQYSIEFEGKDPTPAQLTQILEIGRKLGVKTIFIQRQFNNKGARLVANELGAKTVDLNPYGDDYLVEMRKIATAISNQ